MRDILIGVRTPSPYAGSDMVTLALWLKVPAGKEVPSPNFRSAIVGADGPSAAELAALQAGSYVEVVVSALLPRSFNAAQTKGYFDAIKDGEQTGLNSAPPGEYYGWSREEGTKAWTTA